jgi:hypothetical protein
MRNQISEEPLDWTRICILIALPGLEVRVYHPVWESLSADPDAFKDAVASQLVHDQGGINLTSLLVRVGNHASENKLI